MTNKTVVAVGNIENYCGLLIEIADTKGFAESIVNVNAAKSVEVCVVLDGERKDFTLQEFKTKLGFSNYKQETK